MVATAAEPATDRVPGKHVTDRATDGMRARTHVCGEREGDAHEEGRDDHVPERERERQRCAEAEGDGGPRGEQSVQPDGVDRHVSQHDGDDERRDADDDLHERKQQDRRDHPAGTRSADQAVGLAAERNAGQKGDQHDGEAVDACADRDRQHTRPQHLVAERAKAADRDAPERESLNE
jgi:hypothetical protein